MSHADEMTPLLFLFCVMLGDQQAGNGILAAAATDETLGILQHSEQVSCGPVSACE